LLAEIGGSNEGRRLAVVVRYFQKGEHIHLKICFFGVG